MLGAFPTPSAAQTNCTGYDVGDPRRDQCFAKATAKAATQTAAASYPTRTATSAPAAQQPAPAATSTSTITPTATLSVTTTTQALTPSATSTPTATRTPSGSPLPTATSTLVGLETVTCAPGDRVTLSGRAAPGRALLVYFNERPVGGSLVRPDGNYTLLLHVGSERPGLYPVEVRERDSRAIVRALACDVPGGTPTPTEEPIP